MTDRIISLDAAIEAVGPIVARIAGINGNAASVAREIPKALSALPAVDDSLQQAMNELNATKDALAEAEAEIAILEGMMHSDDAIHHDLQEARQEAQRLKYENDGPQY